MRKALLFLFLSSLIVLGACSNNDDASGKEKKTKTDEIQTINTADLQANNGKGDWVIVDTRSNDAFNGWALDGVKRGGHIKGAVDFSADWLKVDADKKELINVLENKGISTEKNVVLYDTNGKDAQTVADFLKENGFKNIYQYG